MALTHGVSEYEFRILVNLGKWGGGCGFLVILRVWMTSHFLSRNSGSLKNFGHLRLFIITAFSFLIIMKDEGPKVFKLVKTNSTLDFVKNNTPSASASEGIIFDKIISYSWTYDVIYKIKEFQ